MSIAKNTFYYSGALVYQKLLGFIYFALIARGLGVEDTGRYVFALSFTTIFAVLADIGFAPVLTREIAKLRDKAQSLFAQVFSVKVIISLITYGLVILFVNLLGYASLVKTLVYIAGLIMVLDSFSLIHWAVFRGQQIIKFEALGVIGFQTITVGFGLTLLSFGFGVVPLLLATLAGSLFYFIFSLSLLVKKLRLKIKIIFSQANLVWFIKAALPFALAGVFARVYTQLDTVMLSKLGCPGLPELCEQNVGWYGVASKVTLALQFIPLALAASLFPAFSEQYSRKPEELAKTYEQAWRYLALIVIPLAGGTIALAPELVLAIWGLAFLPAALPLQILMGSLVFLFLTFPNGSLLNAAGRQAQNTFFMGLAVIVNIILNIVLIQKMQMTGAALASIASTGLLFTLGSIKSYSIIKFRLAKIFVKSLKILSSGLIMTAAVVYLKEYMSLYLIIPLGGIIYTTLSFLLGELKKQDFLLLKSFLPGKQE